MKYYFLILIPLSLTACAKSSDVEALKQAVDANTQAISKLSQQMAEQEAFSSKAKDVIAEHRAHIQGIEEKLAPKRASAVKTKARGKRR